MIDKFFSWVGSENYWRWLIGAHVVLGHFRLAQSAWAEDGGWFWVQAPILGVGMLFMLAWLARAERL